MTFGRGLSRDGALARTLEPILRRKHVSTQLDLWAPDEKGSAMKSSRIGGIAAATALFAIASAVEAQWPQWGGPGHDFQAPPVELATSWPDAGPPRLWSRPLGDGNSAISVEGGVAYTLYRNGEEERVIALNADSGKVLWEVSEPAALWPTFRGDYGPGPHVTPLVAGDRVFAAGIRARLLALDRKTGKRLWVRDLWEELGSKPPERGYSASPLAYGDLVIVAAGSPGPALAAFRQDSGSLAWKSPSYAHAFSSPILVRAAGRDQVVLFLADRVAGFDPRSGSVLWEHPHETQYQVNASTPVPGEGDLLLLSSAYDAGSRLLQLEAQGEKVVARELWFTRRMRVHHGTAVFRDGVFYGSSGDFGPAFVTAVEAKSGKVVLQERGFAKANLVGVGNRLLLLDEDGVLALLDAKPGSLEVLAQAQVLKTRAWTVPTLAGTTLYLRDRQEIVALDLRPRGTTAKR